MSTFFRKASSVRAFSGCFGALNGTPNGMRIKCFSQVIIPQRNEVDEATEMKKEKPKKTNEEVLKKRDEIIDTLEFYRKMDKKDGSTLTPGKDKSLFEVYREVKFFLKENEGSHMDVVAGLLNRLVDTIREVRDVQTARVLLDLLVSRIENCGQSGLTAEQVVKQLNLKPKITKLLQVIIDAGNDVTGAITFLKNAKNQQGQTAAYIGTSAFTVVLNGLVAQLKVKNPTCEYNTIVMKRAMELFNWMDESDEVLVPPDEFTFTTLIKGFALINDMAMAVELFNQMSTEYGMKPPAVTKAVILEGYVNERNTDKAYEFFKVHCNEPLGSYYNTLVTGFTNDGKLNKAYDLIDEMKNRNIPVSTETFNAFLLGLLRSKNYSQQDIELILRTMEITKLTPNAKTYSLIIRSLIQHGKLDEAIAYYALHPEAIFGAKIIASSLLKAGRLEEADTLMNQMMETHRKYNIDPKMVSIVFEQLIKVLLSVGCLRQANYWKKQLPRLSFVSFNAANNFNSSKTKMNHRHNPRHKNNK